MKKKHILAILLALGCSAAAAGAMACQTTGDDGGKDQNQGQTDDDQNPDDQDPDDQNPDEPDENSIAGIAKNGKKGTQYTVEGVVYGELSDGYFISDGTGGIFVADDEEVSVGDKLSVTATLSVTPKRKGSEGVLPNTCGKCLARERRSSAKGRSFLPASFRRSRPPWRSKTEAPKRPSNSVRLCETELLLISRHSAASESDASRATSVKTNSCLRETGLSIARTERK